MDQATLLIVAMAEKCKAILETKVEDTRFALQRQLQPKHLLWMTKQIIKHAEDWPSVKLHRWIGFVQCGMMANLILDIDGAQSMFNEAKKAHGNIADDLDLVDHLDSDSSFEIDLGGQG
jgi:hypothetical protein